MKSKKSAKASRHVPEHIKRAVNARDRYCCRSCGIVTEFIHYDHVFPFDLGGPTAVENIQTLCPKCNTSKGNNIQCHHCRHWFSPDHTRCPQCGAPFPYSKHSQTLAGRLDHLFRRVGRAVVIGGAASILLLFLAGGLYVYLRGGSPTQAAEQAANVRTVVNDSFAAAPESPASFRIAVPAGARNARVVGGYKVTSGPAVNCYVLDDAQYRQVMAGAKPGRAVAAKENLSSVRLRQTLSTGTYYLVFAAGDAVKSTVAAEFYLKFD